MPQVNPIIKQGLQDKATRLLLDGKGDIDIAEELGVSRKAISSFKRKIRKGAEKVQTAQTEALQTAILKGAIRLEISQENALSDLSMQMIQYTAHYEQAVKNDDMKAAYAWSARRVDLLEKMLKVTGLYDAPTMKGDQELPRIFEVVLEDVELNGEFTERMLEDPVACDLARQLIKRVGLPKEKIPFAFQTLETKEAR